MSILSESPSSHEIGRFHLEHLLQVGLTDDDGADVIFGLTQRQKTLPSRYFYDDKGSELFEVICTLPEYYPTRTETAILVKHAPEIAQLTGVCQLVELGSGSSTKTRLLLDAYEAEGYPLVYLPIDVSAGILKESARDLLTDYPQLQVRGLVSTYQLALESLGQSSLPGRMIFFLGSTLGNFTPQECDRFFAQVLTALEPGEHFLLGIDLQKPTDILEAAYNDNQGVTAAFNLNMLAHLNWRFGGNFDLNLFQHRAFYNESEGQMEMHLISGVSHSVRLHALDLTVEFAAGETIRTEISRKFNLQHIQQYLQEVGFKPLQIWTDTQQWFGLLLAQVL